MSNARALKDLEHTAENGVCGRCQGRSDWDILAACYKKVEDGEERATILTTHLTEACRQLDLANTRIHHLETERDEMKANLLDTQQQLRVTRGMLDYECTNHKGTRNQLSNERENYDDVVLTLEYYAEKLRQAERCHDLVLATAKQGLAIIDRQQAQIARRTAAARAEALADGTDIDTDTEDDMTDAGDIAETEYISGLDFPEDNQPCRTIITER